MNRFGVEEDNSSVIRVESVEVLGSLGRTSRGIFNGPTAQSGGETPVGTWEKLFHYETGGKGGKFIISI